MLKYVRFVVSNFKIFNSFLHKYSLIHKEAKQSITTRIMYLFGVTHGHLILLLSFAHLVSLSFSVVISTRATSSILPTSTSTSLVSTTSTSSITSSSILSCAITAYTTLPAPTTTASINGSIPAPTTPCDYGVGCSACGVSLTTEGLYCGYCFEVAGTSKCPTCIYQLNSNLVLDCCLFGQSTFCSHQLASFPW